MYFRVSTLDLNTEIPATFHTYLNGLYFFAFYDVTVIYLWTNQSQQLIS